MVNNPDNNTDIRVVIATAHISNVDAFWLQCTHMMESPKLTEQSFHAGTHLLIDKDMPIQEVVRKITLWVQNAPLSDCSVLGEVGINMVISMVIGMDITKGIRTEINALYW